MTGSDKLSSLLRCDLTTVIKSFMIQNPDVINIFVQFITVYF